MKKVKFGKSGLQVSAISLGCMRINNLDEKSACSLIDKSLELGINFFDHADIYGGGECEKIFSNVIKLNNIKREDIFIQSKCGIVPNVMFDFSKQHILNSVDGILKRLNIEYLDCLLLHRPDTLFEPEEVAEAFSILENNGKVKYFGVSNQNPYQIKLLKKYLTQDICANQLQFSITESNMISNGLEVNMKTDGSINRDGGILEYCRLEDITIQAWSPFQYGFFEGVFINNDKFRDLNNVLNQIGNKYNVNSTTIATAWILRHPANMQAIVGTTNKERLTNIAKASEIFLTKEEWYKIYLAGGHILP